MAELVGPKKEDNDWYDQLLEAYSNMDPKSKKKMYEIHNTINNACDMLIESGKANRKPRKRKARGKRKTSSQN